MLHVSVDEGHGIHVASRSSMGPDTGSLWPACIHVMCVFADASLDTSLTVKTGVSASPWDPVHSSTNGAHAASGVAAGGIDDEFDLLSSRSKSPPNASAASAGRY